MLRNIFKKGMLLYCEGRIRTDRYTDQEGQEKTVRKIRVISYQMIDSSTGSSTRVIEDSNSGDAQD